MTTNAQSDSDFVPDSDSTSDAESIASNYFGFGVSAEKPAISFLENLSETDIADITTDIYAQLDDYMTKHILSISSPSFYEDTKTAIAQTLYETWVNAELCEEDDDTYDETYEFIEQTADVYFEVCSIPMRSMKYDQLPPLSIDMQNDLEDKIQYLLSIEQPKQRTKEWYEFRNGLITASNLWKVFGSDSQRNSLIYEKCKAYNVSAQQEPETKDYCNTESPMHWGVKYEPVTVMVYEHMYGTSISDFGCIQHPIYTCIGASPDGINSDRNHPRFGRMLEIKNIKNREITDKPKEEYWVQTQIQMETCDLDLCDFVETRFCEFATEDEFYADTEHEYKGVILYFVNKHVNAQPTYMYMPLDLGTDKEVVEQWIRTTKQENKAEGLVLYTALYWYLDEFSCIVIPRNKPWFAAAVPEILDLWQIIETERVAGFEHRNSKKRSDKTTVSESPENSSYLINNLRLTNSICLVKLDSDEL